MDENVAPARPPRRQEVHPASDEHPVASTGPVERSFRTGPFFRIEPLGMEYVAAALEARGHRVTLVDLRFGRSVHFERLWEFVERHRLYQAGFTILTPLPGTAYFEAMRPKLKVRSSRPPSPEPW